MTTAKNKTMFVVRPTGVRAIYSDRDKALLARLSHKEIRASHVDPLAAPRWYEWFCFWRLFAVIKQHRAYKRYGDGHWAIYWLNEVRSWSCTFADDAGQPFTTKAEAEMFEVARLERDFFHTRPKTALHIVSLSLEKKEK